MPVLPLKNAGFEEYETWYLKQKKMEPVNCLTDQEMDWLIVRNEKIIFSDYALETYKDTINCTINYMERIDDWKQHKSNVSFALSSNGLEDGTKGPTPAPPFPGFWIVVSSASINRGAGRCSRN